MKQNEIIETVKEKFKPIHKRWPKLVSDFDMEIIHDFRVDMKKLRAFLRLVNLEDNSRHAVISNKMKTFYGYTGIIRNIQLQKKKVEDYTESHGEEIPADYIALLDSEEVYWQKQTLDLMTENNFYDDEDRIMDQLPDRLKKTTIKAFITEKLTAINILINRLVDDDDLHDIRKILKDLLYTWTYIEPYADLPEIISNEDAIKTITTNLGEFRDCCIHLNFLYHGYMDKLTNEKEKISLNIMKNEWLIEKIKLKKKIVAHLRLFHFPYTNKPENLMVNK